MIDHIKNVSKWLENEKQRLETGRPSVFGFPGSKITPHWLDYFEVRLFWDFVGEAARIQNSLQNYFDFKLENLTRPISLVPTNETVFLPIERELPLVAPSNECMPLFYESQECEQVDLFVFSTTWLGFPIYFKCGYGKITNRLVFSQRLDYSIAFDL